MRWLIGVVALWGTACGGNPASSTDGPVDTPEDSPATDTEVGGEAPDDSPAAKVLRIATFNVSLYGNAEGELLARLAGGQDEAAKAAAAILQTVRPEVVLINEIDTNDGGSAVTAFLRDYVGVSQDGREALAYDHVLVPPTNTGVASGADLDGDGTTGGAVGSQAYAADAKGFGVYPGQYGLAVLSRVPLGDSRTFAKLLWRDVPSARLPQTGGGSYYSEAALAALPLSSKTHLDVAVPLGDRTFHLLASHPTPPTFDGPEDRNGLRNHDEIVFWRDYVDAGADSWHQDDAGVRGGLAGAAFVIAGDLNADPNDGDSTDNPVGALLAHPRVQDAQPSSVGGAEQAALQGGLNASHSGDPSLDTSDFADDTVGNLRIDHVLPSVELEVVDSGVFWPAAADPYFALVGTFPFPGSDHRLVWVDVRWVE